MQARGPGSGRQGRARETPAARLAAIIGRGAQGAALAQALAREGIRTRGDLKRPAVFARLPREAQASVLYAPTRSITRADARAATEEVQRRLRLARGARVVAVGGVRREARRVKDLDFLVIGQGGAPPALRAPGPGDRLTVADCYAGGPQHWSVILRWAPAGGRARHYRADFFFAAAAEAPYALFHYTGPRAYNIRTRALAKRRGWRLNQYGLFEAASGRRVRGSAAVRTERDLAALLGVTYRLPAARER